MTPENVTELEALKLRAVELNIAFHPSIGLDKLLEKVTEVEAVLQFEADEEARQANIKAEADAKPETEPVEKQPETEHQRRVRAKQEASALVHIRITCMNPNKKEQTTELFVAGNTVVGTFKRVVPYDTDWHVPRIIFNMIKSRKFSSFYTVKGKRGINARKVKSISEFGVEVLTPMTPRELRDLAQRQAMSSDSDE